MLPMLEADCGAAIKDSKMMPQEKSNIKMLPPPEPMSRFFGFHLHLSLHVTPSRKKNDVHSAIIINTS